MLSLIFMLEKSKSMDSFELDASERKEHIYIQIIQIYNICVVITVVEVLKKYDFDWILESGHLTLKFRVACQEVLNCMYFRTIWMSILNG